MLTLYKKSLSLFAFGLASLAASAGATDLSILKTAVDTSDTPVVEVARGDLVDFEIIVTDSTEGVLGSGVFVTDEVPSEISILGVDTDFGQCNLAGQQVTCDLNGIADGATVRIFIRGQLSDNAVVGSEVTNTAKVTASNEIDPGDNEDSTGFLVGDVTLNDPDEVSGGCALNARKAPTRSWSSLRRVMLD